MSSFRLFTYITLNFTASKFVALSIFTKIIYKIIYFINYRCFNLSVFKNISTYMLKCKHMTLAVGMLKNIFPLYIKKKKYHLKYANVLL